MISHPEKVLFPDDGITKGDLAAYYEAMAPVIMANPERPELGQELTALKYELVIANGDGRFRLASSTADRVRPRGYIIDLGDALSPVTATVIYYRPGLADEANAQSFLFDRMYPYEAALDADDVDRYGR